MKTLFRTFRTVLFGTVALLMFYLVASNTFIGKIFIAQEDAIYSDGEGALLFLKEGSGNLYFLFAEEREELTQLRLKQNWSSWESNESHWNRLFHQTWDLDCFEAKFTSWCCESNNITCRESNTVIDILITPKKVLIENDEFVKRTFEDELWRTGVACWPNK